MRTKFSGAPLEGELMGRIRAALAACWLAVPLGVGGTEATRFLRYPDIHEDQVVFAHSGDLWTAPVAGGEARRLTAKSGVARWPKFSPDGGHVAFSADWHGNQDIFVIPSQGGEAVRVTYHPVDDQMVDWRPDGKALLFRSMRDSFRTRFMRLHLVSPDGGFVQPFPLDIAEGASFHRDGQTMAFTWKPIDRHDWKAYRGGGTPDIWLRRADGTAKKLVGGEANDAHPMWLGDKLYFISDRGPERLFNLYVYCPDTETTRRLTHFQDFSIKEPAAGPGGIVFENGALLYRYDPARDALTKLPIVVSLEEAASAPEIKSVGSWLQGADLAPEGDRAAFEARGEIFVYSVSDCGFRNLTQTPAVRERGPVWSADGARLAYFADPFEEWQLFVRDADGATPAQALTEPLPGYFANLRWSPDGTKLLYSDQGNRLYWLDLESRRATFVFQDRHGGATHFVKGFWSPDSRWILYSSHEDNRRASVFLYSLESGETHRVTSRLSRDAAPAFDPQGRYVYWSSMQRFNLNLDAFDYNLHLDRPAVMAGAVLGRGWPDPFAPTRDEVEAAAPPSLETARFRIDLEALDQRLFHFPIASGAYIKTTAAGEKLFYADGREGSPHDGLGGSLDIRVYDLRRKRELILIRGVEDFWVTRDGETLMYQAKGGKLYGLIHTEGPHRLGDGEIDFDAMRMTVDYRAEWRQMFLEAWRQARDFFYDRDLKGLDWDAVRVRYEPLLDHLCRRDDLNDLLGDLLSELSTSHAYHGGGDMARISSERVGLLGCDFSVEEDSGYYRFAKIYRGDSYDPDNQGPLARPGLDVAEGDYLISVEGEPLRFPANPIAFFRNRAHKPTIISVNDRPEPEGARRIVVQPVARDNDLRYYEWLTGNLARVDRASGGRAGYVHLMNTHLEGIAWFSRLFYSQLDKQGLIIDARFNNGGLPPIFLAERMRRPHLFNWALPFGDNIPSHTHGHHGKKVMLTNAWSGSGGDHLPYYFQQLGLGPVIGGRSYGAVTGITGNPRLMDNGFVTIPNFVMQDLDGRAIIENEGVTPDIFLENTPDLGPGRDAQLERAIHEILDMIEPDAPQAQAPSAH